MTAGRSCGYIIGLVVKLIKRVGYKKKQGVSILFKVKKGARGKAQLQKVVLGPGEKFAI